MKFKNSRNPILPPEYHIPDSEAHVMPDGNLYIYGSYDDRDDVYCSEIYRVLSTTDLEHWTLHEEALNGNFIPWFNDPDAPKYPGIDWSHPTPFIRKMIQRDIENGVDMKAKFEEEAKKNVVRPAILFAPDCIERNGKYYLYFCMPDDSEGVAVSDRPEGPFSDPVRLPCGGIDPAVFIDDDGQAYYYWGQLFSHGVRLNADMISFDRNSIVDDLVTEEEHFFHEGSSMRKIGNRYYYVYADMERGKPTALGYSVSDSPLGPFEYKGIIIDNDGCDPASWNNHGSIECFDGKWYVFYHRCSRGTQQYRRLCIEPITINPDGTIDEVVMTSQGAGEPFGPGEPIPSWRACSLKGNCFIDAGRNSCKGSDSSAGCPEVLTNISDGDEAVFRYVRNEVPWTKARITCNGRGRISVSIGGIISGTLEANGPDIGTPYTVQTDISAPEGVSELSLTFDGTEALEIIEVILF